jgi:hypothetical protein
MKRQENMFFFDSGKDFTFLLGLHDLRVTQ